MKAGYGLCSDQTDALAYLSNILAGQSIEFLKELHLLFQTPIRPKLIGHYAFWMCNIFLAEYMTKIFGSDLELFLIFLYLIGVFLLAVVTPRTECKRHLRQCHTCFHGFLPSTCILGCPMLLPMSS